METSLPMILFLTFLFGSVLLIVVGGYRDRAQERTEEGTRLLDSLDLANRPRFFGKADSPAIPNPVAVVVDESSLRRLESFLREELALAEVFLRASAREDAPRAAADEDGHASLGNRLEGYLRSEEEAVARFVLNPSAESLYGRLLPIA